MTSTPLLTIAGYDPSSGAGITADLAVFAAHGFFGTSAITALTVQSTLGVRASHPVAASLLAATLACLEQDVPAAGVKIGMLGTIDNVLAVTGFLEAKAAAGRRVPVVLDPVLVSSSGRELLTADGVVALRERLLPRVDWVTPNWGELARLSGRPVGSREQVAAAARELMELFPGLSVAATGGDEVAPDDLVADALGGSQWLAGSRIASDATHGTGCAFSSAFLCGLVRGQAGLEAGAAAKAYVAEAIRRAVPMGGGKGPMHLLWPLDLR